MSANVSSSDTFVCCACNTPINVVKICIHLCKNCGSTFCISCADKKNCSTCNAVNSVFFATLEEILCTLKRKCKAFNDIKNFLEEANKDFEQSTKKLKKSISNEEEQGDEHRVLTKVSFNLETKEANMHYARLPTRPVKKPPSNTPLPNDVVLKFGSDFAVYILKILPTLGIECYNTDSESDTYDIRLSEPEAEFAIDWKHLDVKDVEDFGKCLLYWGYKWNVYEDEEKKIHVKWQLA